MVDYFKLAVNEMQLTLLARFIMFNRILKLGTRFMAFCTSSLFLMGRVLSEQLYRFKLT